MSSDAVFIYLTLCGLLTVVSDVIDTNGVKTLSVLEGGSVTLNADVKVETEDQILWTFGPQSMPIAEIIKRDIVYVDEKFRKNLHMDNQTGSLTIKNIRSEHGGLYQLQISSKLLLRRFNVVLFTPLPIPIIKRDCSHCSSSSPGCSSVRKCLLLCSVANVRNVTLSWYKGNSLLSSISVSDLSISLSLPLEVECLDDPYSCVVAYSFTNQTKHLNITDLCLTCAELRQDTLKIVLITSMFLLFAFMVPVLLMVYRRIKKKKRKHKQSRLRKNMDNAEIQCGNQGAEDKDF